MSEPTPHYFPPMLLLLLGQPVSLVIIYAAAGAVSMPFLVIVLLWLLNSQRVGRRYRNGIMANAALAGSLLLFLFLGVQELIGLL